MATYRASLTLDVGANASFDALAAIFSDFRTVLDFAQDVQAVIDRNDAVYSVLRRPDFGPIFDEFAFAPGYVRSDLLASLISSGAPFLRSAAFEIAVEQQLTELGRDRIVRVEGIRYLNPLDVHLNFDGGGIARTLEVIRDWSANRREAAARARVAEAAAREAEARASSYEEDLQFRREAHDILRGAFISGGLRIGQEELLRLMTDEVERSFGALVRTDVEVDLQAVSDDSDDAEQS